MRTSLKSFRKLFPIQVFSFGTASLNALSPLDGRYERQTQDLRGYFSEAALMKYKKK